MLMPQKRNASKYLNAETSEFLMWIITTAGAMQCYSPYLRITTKKDPTQGNDVLILF
jgi:hypothetical protein